MKWIPARPNIPVFTLMGGLSSAGESLGRKGLDVSSGAVTGDELSWGIFDPLVDMKTYLLTDDNAALSATSRIMSISILDYM